MSGNLGSPGIGTRLGAVALVVVVVGLVWQLHSKSTPSPARPAGQPAALPGTPAPGSWIADAPPPAAPRHAAPPLGQRTAPAELPVTPAASAPAPAYDPFARHGDEDPPARVLVAVGELQLGVLTDARVRDEANLVALLTRIGSELEQLRIAPDQTAAAARHQLVTGYQKELGRYVDGEVELHGRDWNLGLEVGEVRPMPLPQEADWRPRPN